jgi:hypothetical protein
LRDVVVLENTTAKPVELSRLSTSCGCLSWLATAPQTVAPGKSVELGYEFRSAGFPGTQTKELILETDDEQSVHRVKLHLEVVPPTEGIPGWGFAAVPLGTDRSFKLDFKPAHGFKTAKLKRHEFSSSSLTLVDAPQKTYPEGEGQELLLKVKATRPEGEKITARFYVTEPDGAYTQMVVEYSTAK